MKHNARTKTTFVAALAACALAACAGAPVSEEKARLAERQLLQPYLQSRTVACNELIVEITPNFHRHVSNPGADGRRQRFERVEKQAQVDKVWTNVIGDRSGWFTVTIGEPPDPTDVSGKRGPHTTFKVMNQFTLRVRERGAMALSTECKGPVLVVQEAGGEARNVSSFAIVDGALQR